MSELKIDLETMSRLANALDFIGSPGDPAVVALREAVASEDPKDINNAHRNAALSMLIDKD